MLQPINITIPESYNIMQIGEHLKHQVTAWKIIVSTSHRKLDFGAGLDKFDSSYRSFGICNMRTGSLLDREQKRYYVNRFYNYERSHESNLYPQG